MLIHWLELPFCVCAIPTCVYVFTDFGMAQHLNAGDHAESFRGSPLYMVCLHATCLSVCWFFMFIFTFCIFRLLKLCLVKDMMRKSTCGQWEWYCMVCTVLYLWCTAIKFFFFIFGVKKIVATKNHLYFMLFITKCTNMTDLILLFWYIFHVRCTGTFNIIEYWCLCYRDFVWCCPICIWYSWGAASQGVGWQTNWGSDCPLFACSLCLYCMLTKKCVYYGTFTCT